MTVTTTRSENRVAAVTGASAGVGRATARTLAEHGFDVGLIARGHRGLEGAAADVRAAGRRALPLPTDVADFDQVDWAARQIEAELGPIDLWINDAMTTVFQRVVDTSPEQFTRAIEVTFLGQVWGTLAALGPMRQRDRGTILNIGSALAFLGIPLQAPYCSAKFACRGFFQTLRAELLEEGSHVQLKMVHLPAVNTPQFDWCQTDLDRHPQPVPPIYQPETAAKYIVKTALGRRSAKVLGSWNKMIVAVAAVAPGFANRFAAVTGTRSQLTDQPVGPDRPSNLFQPADADADFGAHGRFDDRAGGVLDPHFLRGLPRTGRQLVRAAAATVSGSLGDG